jgi:hypothetical protein
MSQSPSTSAPSSRFQAIFDAALKSYQRQTKKDILAHPLASQLQSCDSTSAIRSVLQDQVKEFDRTCGDDEGMTKWLTPTVNVLYAFSAAVSGGVSLVSLKVQDDHMDLEASSHIYFVGIFACECHLCRNWRLHSGKYRNYFIISLVGSLDLTLAIFPIGSQGRCGEQRGSFRAL